MLLDGRVVDDERFLGLLGLCLVLWRHGHLNRLSVQLADELNSPARPIARIVLLGHDGRGVAGCVVRYVGAL